MKVHYLRITNFRGFEQLELKPQDHVFLVGQPGAGRSDLVEALSRVLSPESARFPLSDDLHCRSGGSGQPPCRDLSDPAPPGCAVKAHEDTLVHPKRRNWVNAP